MLRRLVPQEDGVWTLGDDGFADALAGLYAVDADDRHGVRINMIASLDGSAVGHDGTSETLSNRVDRAILKTIRSLADAVVVGAGTVRREGYLGPVDSTLVIVTRSGDLRGHRLHDSERPPLILRPAEASDRVEQQLDGIPHRTATLAAADLDGREVVDRIREAGLSSIVCEGGPRLTGALLAARVVDEFCLTSAPLFHSPGLPLVAGAGSTVGAELRQLLVDAGGTLYGRWRIAED